MTHPTEPTFVLANAILYIASHTGPIENLQVDSQKSLAVLKELKTMVKLGCKRVQHSGIVFYPADSLLILEICPKRPGKVPTDMDRQRNVLWMSKPLRIWQLPYLQEIYTTKFDRGVLSGHGPYVMKTWVLCLATGCAITFLLVLLREVGMDGNGFNLQMLGNGTPKRKRSQLAIEDAVPHEATPGPKEVAPKPDDNQEPGVEKQSAQASNPKGIDGMAASIADQLVANSNEKKDKSKKIQQK